MFFRFTCAVVMVVMVSLIGVAIEKSNLAYRRSLTRQSYQLDVLIEQHATLRLRSQQMGTPVRLIDPLKNGELELRQPTNPVVRRRSRIPLLQWQRATPSHDPAKPQPKSPFAPRK